jgi:hypothetical protein
VTASQKLMRFSPVTEQGRFDSFGSAPTAFTTDRMMSGRISPERVGILAKLQHVQLPLTGLNPPTNECARSKRSASSRCDSHAASRPKCYSARPAPLGPTNAIVGKTQPAPARRLDPTTPVAVTALPTETARPARPSPPSRGPMNSTPSTCHSRDSIRCTQFGYKSSRLHNNGRQTCRSRCSILC